MFPTAKVTNNMCTFLAQFYGLDCAILGGRPHNNGGTGPTYL